MCEAVVTQSYGSSKAQDVICTMVSCFGSETWDNCAPSYHRYLSFLAKQFMEDETITKFEMCKTLVFLLSAAPNDKDEIIEPPWIRPIVKGLENILRSKIGSDHRELALRLASAMILVCGIYSMQPPYTTDFKLFLLTTHLCCVEVRMVLEDQDLAQANNKGRLLSSCYTFLESVINHLTSGPPLDLDDRQVMQLHSAMVGAFGAVIHYLKRISVSTEVQWNSIMLATVRVLGAWLAEETSALREEIYDLIPFLVQVSKMCIPPSRETQEINKKTLENGSTEPVIADKLTQESSIDDSKKVIDLETCCSESKLIVTNLNGATEETSSNNADIVKESVIENHLDGTREQTTETNHNETECKKAKTVTFEKLEKAEKCVDAKMGSDAHLEKDVLTEDELQELHLKVDILHYLLPGWCHLTAEEEPRRLLLGSGALGVLDLYMWRQWERLVDRTASPGQTSSCLMVLCNIFLNLVIVDPGLVTENKEFSHILLLVVKGIHIIDYDSDFIVLWSNFVTLGLLLLRSLHKTAGDFLEPESIERFFQSTIRFLSGAYTARHKKKGSVLDISEAYKIVWDQISQTWFISMQAFSECIPKYQELPGLILKAGWLPSLLKVIADVKANTVAEETKSCFQMLLTAVAKDNKAARAVIKEKGGDNLARFFKSKELTNSLNS
ncbi:neurochondrin-like isoform X9 [Dreissena polymorpha]|uniref:neurochondrin-like isoform X5 n=1 Tax=Dreissena polymorpha TaxID=45954 RepID=UPI0022655F54|nr:neurochondrin-like isoform X5 [Dreissena polymorpha]XP_052230313.1 neurochondrin-like isoform X6 [Dreissena polymorpha]XP_052230314.1 neurochondrin-like isoform X7 [Dreissena polymorpha]XP_052230315.1 neurochondrin-like isoform X8 [Dreissena polymorpha]XP_052230316.1 neurochondrin-like isoform X9 [Dreissena polymorpha]